MPSPEDVDLACWHRHFAAQVVRSPDAAALATAEGSLTYRELDGRANALAHRLVARGVGPERIVAVTADRSFQTVVGMLGVLKAGGAFLLLDPSYPAERLDYMVRDCGASVVLGADELVDLEVDASAPDVALLPANLSSKLPFAICFEQLDTARTQPSAGSGRRKRPHASTAIVKPRSSMSDAKQRRRRSAENDWTGKDGQQQVCVPSEVAFPGLVSVHSPIFGLSDYRQCLRPGRHLGRISP